MAESITLKSRSKTRANIDGGSVPALTPAEQEDELQREAKSFAILVLASQVILILIYLVDLEYAPGVGGLSFYGYFSGVSIMIFYGFGYLMTFLRRYGFSAVGYTLLVSCQVIQWSVPLQNWFESAADVHTGHHEVGVLQLLNGLFCAGAVMISYGAVLGKATVTQLLVMGLLEALFYWINVYFCALKLEAVDVGGGMYIHMFGAYFGLVVTRVLDTPLSRKNKDNTSNYSSDLFSLTGTLFLWIMWPSFNAAVASTAREQMLAVTNTFLSLTGSTMASFVVSRLVSKGRFDVVHVQNSTLAGGVAMGVVAHLEMLPGVAILMGFLAGTISVLGYRYLSTVLNDKLRIQDVCGVHNLHGLPGLFASLLAVGVTAMVSDTNTTPYPRGSKQPGYQLAATFVSLVSALVGGLITGLVLKVVQQNDNLGKVHPGNMFNDAPYWEAPSDYLYVVDEDDSQEQEMVAQNA